MAEPLDPVAVRVLGSLVEKERTTPDNYPLTLNALVSACNQTSNREPVMSLSEQMVAGSLDDLRRRSLVRAVQRSDSRVLRYSQLMGQTMDLGEAELAALCVLMLRGPQTIGEIKGRTERLFTFRDLEQVEQTLRLLSLRQPEPLVATMPRRAGQKEERWAQLLAGEPAPETPDAGAAASVRTDGGRVDALAERVSTLEEALADLRSQFDAFRREFQ